MIDMVSQDENYGLLLDNKKVVFSFFHYFWSFAQSEFPLLLFGWIAKKHEQAYWDGRREGLNEKRKYLFVYLGMNCSTTQVTKRNVHLRSFLIKNKKRQDCTAVLVSRFAKQKKKFTLTCALQKGSQRLRTYSVFRASVQLKKIRRQYNERCFGASHPTPTNQCLT